MLLRPTLVIQFIALFILAIAQVFFEGCNSIVSKAPTAAEYEQMMEQISEQHGRGAEAFDIIDSIYRSNPNAAGDFKFKFYNYACGYYHIIKDDQDSAMLYADSMLHIIDNRNDKATLLKEEAIANISMGDILLSKNNYERAYRYFYLGKMAAEKSTDPCTYSEYSYRLGMVSYKQADFRRAADYFKQSFYQSLSCSADYAHLIRQQEVLDNVALSYYNLQEYDSAAAYFDTTIAFINKHTDAFSIDTSFLQTAKAVAYATKAMIEAQRNIPEAKGYFERSVAINAQPGHDNAYALATQVSYAKMYVDAKQWDNASVILQQVKAGLDTIKNEESQLNYNMLMYECYDHLNNIPLAYDYLKSYRQLKTELASRNNLKNSVAVTDEIDNLQRQYELSVLKSDKRVKTLYLFILVSVLVLLAVILFFIRSGGRKAKKNLQLSATLNAQIQQQKLALEQANEKLAQRNNEKDAILRVVAHDLRNPISGVYASLDIMQEVYEVSDDQKEYIHLMKTACSDALELINSLLDVTSDSNGKSVPKKPVDLAAIVKHCVHLLQFRAAEKNQVIEMNIDSNTAIVDANEEKLRRVINNLLTNAIKFSNSGANIHVTLSTVNGEVQAKVKDNGIGIPPEMQPTIFDVFTKAKRYGTKNEKPYGLGLSICKQIIEDHSGRIWFESGQGKGTSFYIALPQSKKPANSFVKQ